MKKIIGYGSLTLLCIVMLMSCNTQKSFTDRHYNNRYYIGMSKAEKPSKIQKDSLTETIDISAEEVIFTTPEPFPSANIDTTKVNESNLTSPNKEGTASTINPSQTAPVDLGSGKGRDIQETPFAWREKAETIKEKISPPDASDDALSLLWIVIIIILILWLIGFSLGGLGMGGAIHILLVIALVLLILWLLGII